MPPCCARQRAAYTFPGGSILSMLRVSAPDVWDECLEVRDNPFDSRCFIYDDHAFILLGSAPTVEFDFIDDRLSSIRLFLHPRGKRFYSREIGEKVFTQLLGLLRNE